MNPRHGVKSGLRIRKPKGVTGLDLLGERIDSGKNVPQEEFQTGKQVATVNQVVSAHHRDVFSRTVQVEPSRFRIKHPDLPYTGIKILRHLAFNFIRGIRRADDFHGQIGNDVPGILLIGQLTLHPLQRNECDVGPAMELFLRRKDEQHLRNNKSQSSRFHEIPQASG